MLSLLLGATNAHALIVSVEGQGDVPAEGMELTIDQAEEDELSGKTQMELKGNMLSTATPVTVTITRSETGVEDEFCCADQCTAGNGELSETKQFNPTGVVSWYAHYTPAPLSNVTVEYRFEAGGESRTITVHYIYDQEGVENVQSTTHKVRKTLKDGVVYIETENKTYTIL